MLRQSHKTHDVEAKFKLLLTASRNESFTLDGMKSWVNNLRNFFVDRELILFQDIYGPRLSDFGPSTLRNIILIELLRSQIFILLLSLSNKSVNGSNKPQGDHINILLISECVRLNKSFGSKHKLLYQPLSEHKFSYIFNNINFLSSCI